MSDFDPDAYLATQATDGGTFDPDTYLREQAKQPPKVGPGETYFNTSVSSFPLARQATQLGATGVLQLAKALGVGRSGVRLGKASLDAGLKQDNTSTIPNAGDTYRQVRQDFGARTQAGTKQNPLVAKVGTATGLGLSLALPVAKVGSGLSGALASGSLTGLGYGAAAGLSDADLTDGTDTARRALMGGGIGAAAGLPAGLISYGAGRLASAASDKVATIDQKVAQKAADEAAAETASARSLAGRTAQDAYRQLEHLRELGAMRALSPQEAQAAASLEQELAAKAQAKLLPAIAEKEAAGQQFTKAAASEGQRASARAEDLLGRSELKRQVMPRLLRYGLPALGGAVGSAVGGPFGAGGGALVGAGLRPMMHSLIRMTGQPVVQRPLMRAISGLASHSSGGLVAPLATEAEQGIGELMPGLLMASDDDARRKGQIAYLRGDK